MTLRKLYQVHDDLEAALRRFEGQRLSPDQRRIKSKLWELHDQLERVVIRAQARRAA